MTFEVQSVEDVQPEGTNNYFVVVGGDTGAPWEQKGFATRETAESAKELIERVANSLSAKLHAAEEREAKWQPIETAPQTGKVFLICDVRGNRGLGFWGEGGLNTTGPWRVVERVSYWMPIPEPPALSNLAGES